MVVSSNSPDGQKNLCAVVEEILTILLKFYQWRIQILR